MNWSARRINAAARINNARTYLEIGVHNGDTFFDVEIEYKDAVDPHFLFETSPLTSEKVRFFSQTSDAFWTSDKPLKYDLIFIDGLHTFEQTFRDLLCSMRFSHDRTVWLIDDTLPTDVVFSAIPDQAKSYRCIGPVLGLGAEILRDDYDFACSSGAAAREFQQTGAYRRIERRTRGGAKTQLHRGRHLIDVLPAGARGAHELLFKIALIDVYSR